MTETEALVVAGEAKGKAETAMAMIEAHEKKCTERWSEARKEWRTVSQELKAIRASALYLAGTIILGLLGVIGYLLINGSPWGP